MKGVGTVSSTGRQNKDGTVNIEFIAKNLPPDIAAAIREGLGAIMVLVTEMADGHVVLHEQGEFAKRLNEALSQMGKPMEGGDA